jgi:hypothetical protein
MDGTEESRHIINALGRQNRYPTPRRGDLLQAGADLADQRIQRVPADLDGPPLLVLRVVDEAVRRTVTERSSIAFEIRRQGQALGTTIVPPLTALPSASPETGAMLFNQ